MRWFAVAVLTAMLGAWSPAQAQELAEPGGTPADTLEALTNPDEYAWRLFLYVNHQAKPGVAGVADATKTGVGDYDPDTNTVWESWALASGLDLARDAATGAIVVAGNVSEVFKQPATEPVAWDALPRGGAEKTLSQDFKGRAEFASSLQGMSAVGAMENAAVLIAPAGSDPEADETRMNRSTYETVRSQRLYSVEGIEAAAATAAADGKSLLVQFEQDSKEVKARWVRLTECDTNPNCADKARYHWRTASFAGGPPQVYGLATLHIITKDLPNWFWSDFSHVDCETGVGACSEFSATTPMVDKTTLATAGVRPETKGSKWENYRLRGAQIDYVTSTGIPTILSNPVIEANFQVSSCITCHSYATSAFKPEVPARGTSLPIFAGLTGVRNAGSQSLDVGPPNCRRFVTPSGQPLTGACPSVFDKTEQVYLQTDFLWSIPFRAFSEN